MVYCERCCRYFNSYFALQQHEKNSSKHYICHKCQQDFTSWNALKHHFVQSRAHDYCQRCDEHFDNAEKLKHHDETEHYSCRQWHCPSCRKFFQNATGLHEHYRQSARHHYCAPCKRHFLSASNLTSHPNSSPHRPKDVPCPGKGCGLAFVSRSALILHLESGTCKSGADHQTINRCYHRTLAALNQPPRHHAKIYVCPLTLCRQHFPTLSGLCQHIESERCGVFKLKVVQNAMDAFMGSLTAN
ncbi:hypothetical protein DFH06DRAFT_979191 [Mycena polygramma]|nr:hypothetical protein DFH06DRAFT_979191 [Mycena polygramma]